MAALISPQRRKAGSHGADAVNYVASAIDKRNITHSYYLTRIGTKDDTARELARV